MTRPILYAFAIATLAALTATACNLLPSTTDPPASELPPSLAHARERALIGGAELVVELTVEEAEVDLGDSLVFRPRLVNAGREPVPIIHGSGFAAVYLYRDGEVVEPPYPVVFPDNEILFDGGPKVMSPGEAYFWERSPGDGKEEDVTSPRKGDFFAVAMMTVSAPAESTARGSNLATDPNQFENYWLVSDPIEVEVR